MLVATSAAGGTLTITSEFQSLAGFLARCDLYPLNKDVISYVKFQSLAGFLARCDVSIKTSVKELVGKFQSLAGFLARCDLESSP